MMSMGLGEVQGKETLIDSPGKQSWADFIKSEIRIQWCIQCCAGKIPYAIHNISP